MSELLPCPFCGENEGKTRQFTSHGTAYWQVRCEECWATSHGSFHLSESGAVEAWNTRAPRPSAPAPTTPVPVAQRKGWPKKGDKMRFLGRNGHDYQLEAAKKVFNTEDIYEVAQFDLGDWSSCILFVGFEGRWNSVMFDWCDAEQVDITPASSTARGVEPEAVREAVLQVIHACEGKPTRIAEATHVILAALFRGEAGWQPIETAPKDGTPVLLASTHERGTKTIIECSWWSAERCWINAGRKGTPEDYQEDWYQVEEEDDSFCRPTHWRMPLSRPRQERGAP